MHERICVQCIRRLVVFYVPSTARSFRDGPPEMAVHYTTAAPSKLLQCIQL